MSTCYRCAISEGHRDRHTAPTHEGEPARAAEERSPVPRDAAESARQGFWDQAASRSDQELEWMSARVGWGLQGSGRQKQPSVELPHTPANSQADSLCSFTQEKTFCLTTARNFSIHSSTPVGISSWSVPSTILTHQTSKAGLKRWLQLIHQSAGRRLRSAWSCLREHSLAQEPRCGWRGPWWLPRTHTASRSCCVWNQNLIDYCRYLENQLTFL